MKDIVQFLSEVSVELNKVVWPKYDDWVGSTIIVFVLVVIFALYLGFIDFGFSKLASLLFKSYGSLLGDRDKVQMKRWYVVQVYAGFEEAVKSDLAKRIHEEGLEDIFGEILIPSATLKANV